jgi:protein CpxP
MIKQLRHLALLTCVTAATAFSSQIAVADSGCQSNKPEAGCRQEHHQRCATGQRRHHFFKKIARELSLTEQQKGQARALFTASHAQNKPLFKALLTSKQQLRALVSSGADEAAIRAQSAKVATAEADLAVKRAQSAHQFLLLLTTEQATKLKVIQAKREKRCEKFTEVNYTK